MNKLQILDFIAFLENAPIFMEMGFVVYVCPQPVAFTTPKMFSKGNLSIIDILLIEKCMSFGDIAECLHSKIICQIMKLVAFTPSLTRHFSIHSFFSGCNCY